jgi:hypothetical protein
MGGNPKTTKKNLDKGCEVKLSKMKKDMAIFEDCMGKATLFSNTKSIK